MTIERIDLSHQRIREDLADLINTCEQREPLLQRGIAADDLLALLTDPGAVHTEGQLWRAASGGIDAFGWVRFFQVDGAINSDLRLFVSPSQWDGDLADRVLAWAGERVQAYRAAQGGTLRLYSDCLPQSPWRSATLERHGLHPVRTSYVMERSLQDPIAEEAPPTGYQLRTLRVPDDLPAWVDVFNRAYAGQWNYVPTTVADQAELRQDGRYLPRYDLVVCDRVGALVAFCLGFVLKRGGTQAGWILEIGTRPAVRGHGLGRVLLTTAMRRFQEDGLASARLVVDGENPSGAKRLYEHLGFTPISSEILYGRTFDTP